MGWCFARLMPAAPLQENANTQTLVRPQLAAMDTALVEKAVEKVLRGPTSTTCSESREAHLRVKARQKQGIAQMMLKSETKCNMLLQ